MCAERIGTENLSFLCRVPIISDADTVIASADVYIYFKRGRAVYAPKESVLTIVAAGEEPLGILICVYTFSVNVSLAVSKVTAAYGKFLKEVF